jgi:hypothetical protein
MKRTQRTSAQILGLLLFPFLGLVGCSDESKATKTETITTPGGTTTSQTEIKVKSTGENPPPNSAGETGKSAN